MTSHDEFFIDGKPFKLESTPLKVAWLLRLVGTSSDDAVLVSGDGIEHGDPDELIEVHSGDHFTTRKRDPAQKPVQKRVRYTVNGEANTTLVNPLPLEAILKSAGPGAAIDLDDLGSYYLENTADGSKYENLDDLVRISDGDNFLAIHVGRTPVA